MNVAHKKGLLPKKVEPVRKKLGDDAQFLWLF